MSRKETDEEFRERIKYVAGDGEAMQRRIAMLVGRFLDEFADNYGLRRQYIQVR